MPIVGSGNRSAILHYNANNQALIKGELLLIDAGAECFGYASDITRTLPTNGRHFSPEQERIASLVRSIQSEVEAQLKPGVEWRHMNDLALKRVCDGLLREGFLHGDLSGMLEARVCSLFMPHGLGHSIGLDVHDPGSVAVLEADMLLTVEPGIYFNRAFIDAATPEQRAHINMPRVQKMLDSNFGGVRFEDVVLITANGSLNLTPGVHPK